MRALCVAIMSLAGVALAQETVVKPAAAATATNQTVITSDRLEFDYPRSIAEFTGNVLVEDKDLKMWADKMTVLLSPTDELESVVAVGHVRIRQPGSWARCRKAIFLVDQNEVILTGDAVIQSGKDRVEGNVIQIWTDSGRIVSEPGHLILQPKD
jgi:lipopolysaccharide transport protein LptA